MTALPTDEQTLEELDLKRMYYQVMSDHKLDPEIQALIRESLGLS